MKVGFHVSIKGGINNAVTRAIELGINTFQIFTRSPRMWKARELSREEIMLFKEGKKKYGIEPVFSHMPYLSNLATPEKVVYRKSIQALELEIQRCNLLDIPYIVTHLGSHLGSGKEKGIKRITNAINTTLDKFDKIPTILLENTSGKTNQVGSTFHEIKTIMENIDKEIGVCLDICHAHSRGYDFKTKGGLKKNIGELEEMIGWKHIHLIHLNDSKGKLGTNIDHHEHIGLGYIGENGFRHILHSRLRYKPMIMETPVNELREDKGNLEKVYELSS